VLVDVMGYKECIQNFGGHSHEKPTRCEDNIKVDRREMEGEWN
jgi:hypothetical protein